MKTFKGFRLVKDRPPKDEQMIIAIGKFEGEISGYTDLIEMAVVCYDAANNSGGCSAVDMYYANLYDIIAWKPVPDEDEVLNGLR